MEFGRTPEQVWKVLGDPTQSTRWIQGLTQVEMLQPLPLAVGSKFRATRTVSGRTTTEVIEVTELEAGRRVAFSAGLMNGGIFLRISYTVTATPGGSRVESWTEGATHSFGSHFYFGMFWKAVLANDAGNLSRLKTVVEGAP